VRGLMTAFWERRHWVHRTRYSDTTNEIKGERLRDEDMHLSGGLARDCGEEMVTFHLGLAGLTVRSKSGVEVESTVTVSNPAKSCHCFDLDEWRTVEKLYE
jgi:hypothetical protein